MNRKVLLLWTVLAPGLPPLHAQASTPSPGGEDSWFGDLASPRAARRKEAARKLHARPGGPWVTGALALFPALPSEGRLRFAEAMGRHPGLLPWLAEALTSGKGSRAAAEACLERHFLLQSLPPPRLPDRVAVLPDRPLLLGGVRDFLDLHDRLLAAGAFGLPVLLDPRFEQPGTWGCKPLGPREGSWLFRELLPPLAGPDLVPLSLLVTRILPGGTLVTTRTGPRSLHAFFPMLLRTFLTGKGGMAHRAALGLGSLDLPTLGPWLETLAGREGGLGRRAREALALRYLRGLEPREIRHLGPAWLADFRQRGRHVLIPGFALRLLLHREAAKGSLPSWARPGDRVSPWEDPALATLLSGVPPTGATLPPEGGIPGWKRAPPLAATLLHGLLLQGGELAPKTLAALKKQVLGGFFRETPEGQRAFELALRLLLRQDPSFLDPPPEPALGKGRERGRIWGRVLMETGTPGSLLEILAGAKALHPALLGLLEAPASTSQEGWRAWGELRPQAPQGQLLLDLAVVLLPDPRVRRREDWGPHLERFHRLVGAFQGLREEDPALERALGRALGRILVFLPMRPGGRSPVRWIGDWLADPRTRALGLAAATAFLPQRRNRALDLERLLRSRLPPSTRSELLGKLHGLLPPRPASLGRAPLDLLDPILSWIENG